MFLLPRRASLALLKTPGLSARFPLLIRGISNSSTSLSHTLPKEDARVSVSPSRPKRIVVAITGATGVALGIRILQILKALSVETHLIISKWGAATMKYETDWEPHDVAALATKTYSVRDVSACISSGSFQHDGMIVAPCSMKSLAAIRIGFTEDLITRAADVSIKENRKLLLVTRETPLSTIHLENMLSLSKIGVTIFPPVPAFYTRPKSMDDILEQSAGRILDCFGIHSDTFPRWEGIKIPSTIEVLDITTLKEGFTLHIVMSQLQPALKFRDFIQVLKDEDDLVEITEEVDSNLEVGAIMRKAYESHLPAPLFRNVKGASKDLFSILGCPAGLRSKEKGDHGRIAHHLGLDPKTPIKEIIDYLLECKDKEPLPPKIVSVSSAPCKEHVLSEGEVHLDSLPAPYLHTSDGGKYLQTYGMWILQTPDKKWTNWSIARGMVVDDKHITGLVIKPQHIRQIADAWAAIGKGDEIPFALCFGVPPAAILVSSMPIPEGESESDYIGAILGEAVPVVKCETNDLLVPATSEMVFEGTLSLKQTHIEGPFGEMHGYVFEGQAHPCPMYTVKAMTYRDNAILPVSNPGICTDETHTLIGSLVATEAKKLAIDSGLPVLDAFTPYEAQALWLVLKVDLKKLQALKTTPEEFCKKVGEIFFRSKVGFIIHEIVLVAEDIDIFNFKEVFWAYVTRHTPVADQMTFDDVTSFPLAPFVSQSPRSKTMKGGKCVTNCIFRQQYERDFEYVTCNFEKGYSKELVDKVNENWKTYGYK